MTEVSNLVKKGRSKPRNNLSSFDTSQIEAELLAIESEVLGLDTAPTKKAEKEAVVEETTDSAVEVTQTFKSRPTNEVEFNPESSELLHRLSRNGLNDKTSLKVQSKTKMKSMCFILGFSKMGKDMVKVLGLKRMEKSKLDSLKIKN
jgi:hypothetical protein